MIKRLEDLQVELTSLGFEFRRIVSGNTLEYFSRKNESRPDGYSILGNTLSGKWSPGGGSSKGNFSVSGYDKPYRIILKDKRSGGSGAGAENTKTSESAQCVYNAAIWYENSQYDGDSLRRAFNKTDVDESIEKIITLPDDWVNSCILTAEKLKEKYPGKSYTFHRGSTWVQNLNNKFLVLNRNENSYFGNLNKWSPADIYMLTARGLGERFNSVDSIIELNKVLLDYLISGDIVGVSLKKVSRVANYQLKNITDVRYTYTFKDLTIGKRGYFLSKDGYVAFSGGNIQFRTFGSTWQGEIKGELANQGKVSGGFMVGAVPKILGMPFIRQSEVATNKNEEYIKKLYTWYRELVSDVIEYEEFRKEIESRDLDFWISKFLTTQLLFALHKSTDNKKDEFVGALIRYAASESELSAPYVKIQ